MNGITIHLEVADHATLQRHAEALGVGCEDIAYAALQHFLHELHEHPQQIDQEIIHIRDTRQHHGPIWGALGHTSHPFEEADNDYAVPGL